MRLKGTTFEAYYDTDMHNLTSLKNRITQDDYIKKVPKVPIIALTVFAKGSSDSVELIPEKQGVVESSDPTRASITYGNFGGYDILVTISMEARGDSLVFSAEISNRQVGIDIVGILFPHLSGIFLGDAYDDDTIIYPHHAGERTLNPVRMYGHDRKEFWRAASQPYGDIYRREINYCGLASMSWMYYQDPCNGLYVGSHDPRFPVTGIIAETGSEDDPYMGFGFRKHHRIATGESYGTGEYFCTISDRDWHYGAQLYRSYILPYLDIQRQPEFLRCESALNQCYNFKKEGIIHHRFKDIPEMFQAGMEWGVRHMFIASWNRTGFDSCYPEYYPDMDLGSAMELRRALEQVHAQGGFTTMYINARIFDEKSEFHGSVGKEMALRDSHDRMVRETYGPESFTVNCPSDRLWQEYLIDTAEFAVKAYGADGIYLDQLASAEPFACYSEKHSHDGIGDFNNGYLYILKEIKARLKAHNADSYLMTENCGDIYGSHVWANLTWNGADYDEYYNVFKYTFPEFTQVNMVNPRVWEKNIDRQSQLFFLDIQRATLLGNIFWIGITSRFKAETGEYYTYMRKALNFRQQLQVFFQQGEFLDSTYISHISKGCDGTCWRLPDGRIMVLGGNPGLDPQAEVEVHLPGIAILLECLDMDQPIAKYESIDTDRLHLHMQGSRLFCWLITLHQ